METANRAPNQIGFLRSDDAGEPVLLERTGRPLPVEPEEQRKRGLDPEYRGGAGKPGTVPGPVQYRARSRSTVRGAGDILPEALVNFRLRRALAGAQGQERPRESSDFLVEIAAPELLLQRLSWRRLAVLRINVNPAGGIAQIFAARRFLHCPDIPEDRFHVMAQTGCMLVPHRPKLSNDVVSLRRFLRCSHDPSPSTRSACISPAARILPVGMPAPFGTAWRHWQYVGNSRLPENRRRS